MVDMTVHLNMLNTTLQRTGGTALHMMEEVLAFQCRLTVLTEIYREVDSLTSPLWESKQAQNMIEFGVFAVCNHCYANIVWEKILWLQRCRKPIILPYHSPDHWSISTEYDYFGNRNPLDCFFNVCYLLLRLILLLASTRMIVFLVSDFLILTWFKWSL